MGHTSAPDDDSPFAGTDVRLPTAAGSFYPENPEELRRLVEDLLAGARKVPGDHPPKALIAPHAGYACSGPIAASAYVLLIPFAEHYHRVVLLGPAHFVRGPGVALPSNSAFRTPLGDVPVDHEAIARLLALEHVQTWDSAHADEHSLEVQLPFLQRVLSPGGFRIVPILLSDCTPDEAAEAVECLWDGPETLFVASSDLSHYYSYGEAKEMDAATAGAIERLDIKGIDVHHACGCLGIQGLLRAAARHGLPPSRLDLRNSGDTPGTRDEVVGYGAFAFHEAIPLTQGAPA